MSNTIDDRSPWDCTCFAARRLARTLTRRYDEALRPLGLRITQFTLLGAIKDYQPITIAELADRTETESSTTSRASALLVERGLVSAEDGPGRQRLLRLTPAGAELLHRAVPVWREIDERMERELGSIVADSVRHAANAVEHLD